MLPVITFMPNPKNSSSVTCHLNGTTRVERLPFKEDLNRLSGHFKTLHIPKCIAVATKEVTKVPLHFKFWL
jgi:hypothetical protein